MQSANIKMRFIDTKNPLYEKECALRVEILRKPLGMPAGTEKFPFEAESLHLIAICRGKVVGCVLFHPEGRETGRLFQMAVAASEQKKGLGKKLVYEMEERLQSMGFKQITLHAREVAAEFYKKIGYEVYGDEFTEVGIKHFYMRKKIA